MASLSPATVGLAGEIAATTRFTKAGLRLLFTQAGLGAYLPHPLPGKTLLVAATLRRALRAVRDDENGEAAQGLREFIRLVAEHSAPREDERAEGTPWWDLRESLRGDGLHLHIKYTDDGTADRASLLPLEDPQVH